MARTTDIAEGNNANSASVEGEHLGSGYIATITFAEFASRYPSLVGVIEGHFAGCQQKSASASNDLHPELVPVLALLASFTPIGEAIASNTNHLLPKQSSSHHLPSHHLTAFLLNRIWKVRMLSARALATLCSTGQLEDYLFERLQLNRYGGGK